MTTRHKPNLKNHPAASSSSVVGRRRVRDVASTPSTSGSRRENAKPNAKPNRVGVAS